MKYIGKKELLLITLLLLGLTDANADRAYPLPVVVQQCDGSSLTIVGNGDEDFHYVTTVDGVLLTREGTNWMVAEIGADGELRSSGVLAHDSIQRTNEELAVVSQQNRALFTQRSDRIRRANKLRREPIEENNSYFPHTGTPKAVVILAEFSDVKFSFSDPLPSFEQYFNCMSELQNLGNGESANACSVRKYFETISFGQYAPAFDVYGPVELPNPLKTYGGENSKGSDENMPLLFQDACSLMDSSIDFSQYDENDDGLVDLVIIIYAGYSESVTGNSAECIWPKAGTTSGGTYDGKKVSRYMVSAELIGFPGCWSAAPYQRINGIGTFCHEMSHCLGLPDFYPTIESVKGDNQGMEFWSIMDSGLYINNGYYPCAYTAWEREAMGWINIPTLTAKDLVGEVELRPIDEGGTAYRILNDNDLTGCEYLIIENIQQRNINSRQKGHGMLMYHVNYDPSRFTLRSNSVNNEAGSPRMTVVPADNWLFAQYNVGKTIDGKRINNSDFYTQLAGDPFPGNRSQTKCSDETGLVNFAPYTGNLWDKAFQNIVEHDDGIITFTFLESFSDDIKTVVSTNANNKGNIYNISGQRVGQNYKGVIIKNGRKSFIPPSVASFPQ